MSARLHVASPTTPSSGRPGLAEEHERAIAAAEQAGECAALWAGLVLAIALVSWLEPPAAAPLHQGLAALAWRAPAPAGNHASGGDER